MKELLPLYTERLMVIETSKDDIDLILKMDKQEVTQRYLGGVKNKSREERLEFLSRKKNSLTVLYNNNRIGFVGLKINDATSAPPSSIKINFPFWVLKNL